MFFFGIGGYDPTETAHVESDFTVQVSDGEIVGNALRTVDGLQMEMTNTANGEKLALSLDYATGLTYTLGGETGSFSFADLYQQLLGDFAQSLGLNEKQLAYLSDGLADDLSAVGPIFADMLQNLPDVEQGSDVTTVTFSGDELPRKLAVALARLLTDEDKLNTLTGLKAWDAFAPEVTDRQAALKQAINDAGQSLVGVKWPFTFTISGDNAFDNGSFVLDVTDSSGAWHGAVVLASTSAGHMLDAVIELTPAGETAVRDTLRYTYAISEDAQHIKQTWLAKSGDVEFVNAELTADLQDADKIVLTLTADTRDFSTGTPTLTLLASGAIDTARGFGFATGNAWYQCGEYDAATDKFATEGTVELVSNENLKLTVTENGESKLSVTGTTEENGDMVFTLVEGETVAKAVLSAANEDGLTNTSKLEGTITRAGVETLHALVTIRHTVDKEAQGVWMKKLDVTVEATGTDLSEPISATGSATCRLVPSDTQSTAEPVEPGATPSLGQILAGVGPQATASPTTQQGGLKPGTYTGVADGFLGTVTATVTVDESGAISQVVFTTKDEHPEHGALLPDDVAFAQQFIGKTDIVNVSEVDTVSCATWTSIGAVDAVNAALQQAK